MAEEKLQQLIFLEGKRHPSAVRGHGMRIRVHHQSAAVQDMLIRLRLAATQHRLHARNELQYAERFG